jgi:hypothetical protein
MSEQARVLADRFEQANREFIAFAQRCSEPQWRAICPDEGWSVGVAAHHLAEDHMVLAGLAQAVATGQPVPALTGEMIDQFNAQHAQQHAACTREETVALLRTNGAAAASIIRELSDEQLERAAILPWEAGPAWSVRRIIEDKLIEHFDEHLPSIRAAVKPEATGVTGG